MRRRQALIVAGASLLTGCDALFGAAVTAGQAASWLSRVLDVAEGGAERYFARHPSPVNASKVDQAIAAARVAAVRLERLGSAAERRQAYAAYVELYRLMLELGIVDGLPPLGGAETNAPLPGPVDLPSVDTAAIRLGV